MRYRCGEGDAFFCGGYFLKWATVFVDQACEWMPAFCVPLSGRFRAKVSNRSPSFRRGFMDCNVFLGLLAIKQASLMNHRIFCELEGKV